MKLIYRGYGVYWPAGERFFSVAWRSHGSARARRFAKPLWRASA